MFAGTALALDRRSGWCINALTSAEWGRTWCKNVPTPVRGLKEGREERGVMEEK